MLKETLDEKLINACINGDLDIIKYCLIDNESGVFADINSLYASNNE